MDVAQILNRGAFVGSSQPPSVKMAHEDMHVACSTDSPSMGDPSPSAQGLHHAAGQQHGHNVSAADGFFDRDQQADHHSDHSHHHDSSVRSISITCPGQIDLTRSVELSNIL